MAESTVTRTEEIVKAEMMQAALASNIDLVVKLSDELKAMIATRMKDAKDALGKKLDSFGELFKKAIDTAVNDVVETLMQNESTAIVTAIEGVWYGKDFGSTLSTIKLVKPKARDTTEGKSKKGGYMSDDRKSIDMLADVGSRIMFDKETSVTIDKKEVTMKAGTTLQQAYDFSQNGGWRNRVRMALMREHDSFLAK